MKLKAHANVANVQDKVFDASIVKARSELSKLQFSLKSAQHALLVEELKKQGEDSINRKIRNSTVTHLEAEVSTLKKNITDATNLVTSSTTTRYKYLEECQKQLQNMLREENIQLFKVEAQFHSSTTSATKEDSVARLKKLKEGSEMIQEAIVVWSKRLADFKSEVASYTEAAFKQLKLEFENDVKAAELKLKRLQAHEKDVQIRLNALKAASSLNSAAIQAKEVEVENLIGRVTSAKLQLASAKMQGPEIPA